MGIVLILIGLIPAGVVADFLIENHIASAPTQSVLLFKRSLVLSQPELVAVGFVLGISSFIFIMLGVGLIRESWGKRKGLKQQVAKLEDENTKLRAREHLSDELKWASEESAEE